RPQFAAKPSWRTLVMNSMPRAAYDGPPKMDPARLRRLQQRQRQREAVARAVAKAVPAPERFELDRMTRAAAALDTAYVAGAPVRALDPEIRRLRRLLRDAS